LAEATLRLARRQRAARVWLMVQPQNERALSLYRRLGFLPVRNDRVANATFIPSPSEEVWVLPLPTTRQATSSRLARVMAPITAELRIRLQGVTGALRFAWIPFVCALVVALASEDPRGRTLALALAVASICLGLGVHAREIVLGRPRPARREPSFSTGEWMARLR
jgi:hypothetical protein